MSWRKNLKIFKGIKGKIKFQEPLKGRTTFKVGGPAKFFVEPKDLNDLKLLLNLIKRHKIPFFLIGRGSNILINDNGLNAIVIRLNASYFKRVSFENNLLNISSGVLLNNLVLSAKEHGLSGAEFLSGIPGTLGGALAMNAGVKGKNISDLVKDVTVMDYNGNTKVLDKKNIVFRYRQSSLSGYVILSARIGLAKMDKKQISSKINRYLKARKLSQDLSRPSAGCVFKNPNGRSAGRLIDLCGLKGAKVGGACVSGRHANFIVNLGNANSKDILRLMGLVKKRVRNRFSVNLEPEIKIWR